MTRLLLTVTLLVIAAVSAMSAAKKDIPPADTEATIERIVDGDTLVIAGGERVRLIGFDAPEKNECYGPEATAHLGELLPPKCAEGYGRSMLIPPNDAHANEIEMAQTAAQTHHRGKWALCV